MTIPNIPLAMCSSAGAVPQCDRRSRAGAQTGSAGSGEGTPAHHEHGARSVVDDVLGDAADEQAAHRAPPVAADHDQIDILARRHVDDGLAGTALPDQEADPHAGLATPVDHVHRGALTISTQVVDPISAMVRVPGGPDVNYAEDKEIGTEVVGEVQRLGRRPVRDGRQIGREQDAADRADSVGARCDSSLGESGNTHEWMVGESRRSRTVTFGTNCGAIEPPEGAVSSWQ